MWLNHKLPQASEFMAATHHSASHLDRVPKCFSTSGTCFLTKKLNKFRDRRGPLAQTVRCFAVRFSGFSLLSSGHGLSCPQKMSCCDSCQRADVMRDT